MRQSLSKSRQLQSDFDVGAPLVRLLCGYVRKRGYRPEEIFDSPLDEDAGTSLAQWHEVLETAAAKLDEPAIGLAIAEQASWRDFGLVGYLASSCATLGEALERSTRYSQLIAQRNKTTFAIEDDLVVLSWTPQRTKTQQLVDDLGIGIIVAGLRFLIGKAFNPVRVDFVSPARTDIDVYRRYFGCLVCFEQAASRLCFARHYLDFPLPSPDPTLAALLDEQANTKLQQLSPLMSEIHKLRYQLIQLIQQGKTQLRDLAEINFMSARALQRLLHQHGSSFQGLLDEARLRLSKQYLADARLDLSTVANLVGYSEQSSFTRAFQQWTDSTPGQWRNAQITQQKSQR